MDPRQPFLPRLDQLSFDFQPVVATGGRVGGWSEALIRWHLPDGTVRGPLDVLAFWLNPVRQESFTRFGIEAAAAALVAHPDARVSVNLGPEQVTDPGVVLALDGLMPHVRDRLFIELTEQRFSDVRRLARGLEAIRERCGVLLLDDVTEADAAERFALAHLFDGVKVDRSVIAHLTHPRRLQRLTTFLAELSDRFEIVVAEGIEDEEQVVPLTAMGATHVQGFGIGRPQRSLGEAVALVADGSRPLRAHGTETTTRPRGPELLS